MLLTVAWKMAMPAGPAIDLIDAVIAFLKRNNFTIVMADEIVNPGIGTMAVPIIQANTGSCTLLVTPLIFDGSNRQLVESRLASLDRRFVVFRGKIYAAQPIFLTVTDYLWSRFLAELGLGARESPAIAIGSDASCNAQLFPWADLHW
jgi:hypothetical protein